MKDNIKVFSDEKEKCIKLKYSSSSAYFEILQSKSLSKLDESIND